LSRARIEHLAYLSNDIAKPHYRGRRVDSELLFLGSIHNGKQSTEKLLALHIMFLERDAATLNGLAQDLDYS